jgi:probable HAF family extracellular repeat protein
MFLERCGDDRHRNAGRNLKFWLGINNSGEIAGRSATASGATNGAGWQLTEATAINASGQITGFGTIDGQQHAFELTPSPEPAAWMAAALALAGLCAMRARLVRG